MLRLISKSFELHLTVICVAFKLPRPTFGSDPMGSRRHYPEGTWMAIGRIVLGCVFVSVHVAQLLLLRMTKWSLSGNTYLAKYLI